MQSSVCFLRLGTRRRYSRCVRHLDGPTGLGRRTASKITVTGAHSHIGLAHLLHLPILEMNKFYQQQL